MPSFYLNDREIEFEPGENVLHAAMRNSVEIPHYCYHPALNPTSQCRMCLIEVTDAGNGRGIPKLQTSCTTQAVEGMRVSSVSERATAGQETVMEFLLINHPLDCPICDQAGECELQNYSHRYGTGKSEMDYEKRVYGLRDVGSFIALERNRCIHCSRCERFSRDIAGGHDFGAFLRGHELTFDTFSDNFIEHKFQGNLADLCPVGAITNRDWRFKKRAWKLNKTKSVCPSCSMGCNITIEQHDNKVYRFMPRQNPSVNRWWMCDEGRISFAEHAKNRLNQPLARVKGRFVPSSWSASIGALTSKLESLALKAADVLVIASTWNTTEELYAFKKYAQQSLGASDVYFPWQDSQPQEQAPPLLEDAFIYSLIQTDKSPNTQGALFAGLKPLKTLAELDKLATGKPKLVFFLGNPMQGQFSDAQWSELIGASELAVIIDSQISPVSEGCDLVLPCFNYAEKYGSFINHQRRVQLIKKALRPPAEARSTLQIIKMLATGNIVKEQPISISTEEDLTEIKAAFAEAYQAAKNNGSALKWDDVDEDGLQL